MGAEPLCPGSRRGTWSQPVGSSEWLPFPSQRAAWPVAQHLCAGDAWGLALGVTGRGALSPLLLRVTQCWQPQPWPGALMACLCAAEPVLRGVQPRRLGPQHLLQLQRCQLQP